MIGCKQNCDNFSKCFVGLDENVGPRQPWHDIHAKVEGQIALDVMKNFEERWLRLPEQFVTPLFEVSEEEFALDAPAVIPENEGGSWNMQLFRSITSDSCIFDHEHCCLSWISLWYSKREMHKFKKT